MQITKELVDAIHAGLDKGLTAGIGVQEEGKMCVEALICFKLGLPHSDKPTCVGEEVRKAKISLNDGAWSTEKVRAEGMRKLAIAQLGSDKLDQKEFRDKLKLNSTRKILPFIIQKHFEDCGDRKLLEYKQKFESLKVLDDALWSEFYNYNNYYYYYYYNYNYYNNYYYNYNYYYYYYYHNGDKFLLLVANTILKTLQEMNCEGCKWI